MQVTVVCSTVIVIVIVIIIILVILVIGCTIIATVVFVIIVGLTINLDIHQLAYSALGLFVGGQQYILRFRTDEMQDYIVVFFPLFPVAPKFVHIRFCKFGGVMDEEAKRVASVVDIFFGTLGE